MRRHCPWRRRMTLGMSFEVQKVKGVSESVYGVCGWQYIYLCFPEFGCLLSIVPPGD